MRKGNNSSRLPKDFILDVLHTDLRVSDPLSNRFSTDIFSDFPPDSTTTCAR